MPFGSMLFGSAQNSEFASGTLMLFQQSAAPTGWTKGTTHDDKALRVVTGAASSGGTLSFSTVFGKTATSNFTLTTVEIPSHSHLVGGTLVASPGAGSGIRWLNLIGSGTSNPASDVTGSSGAHAHSMDIRTQYVDIIIASKN